MDLAVGRILNGKYRVEKILGKGGMGFVLEAFHLDLECKVAVKLLHAELRTNQELVERFLREGKCAARISNEHVAKVFDVGRLEDGTPYLVMEYLVGHDLSVVRKKKTPLPRAEAIEYILQACSAIAEAHAQGIIHRDIKPANLFLTRGRNGRPTIKLLDFGISKLSSSDPLGEVGSTKSSVVMGSAEYMSPEQMLSTRDADHRTDIWALGVVLFELLTASVPFTGETLTQVCMNLMSQAPPRITTLRPELGEDIERVVARCLEKDRERRYASAEELAIALDACRKGKAQTAPGTDSLAHSMAPPTQPLPTPLHSASPQLAHANQAAQAALAARPPQPPQPTGTAMWPQSGAPAPSGAYPSFGSPSQSSPSESSPSHAAPVFGGAPLQGAPGPVASHGQYAQSAHAAQSGQSVQSVQSAPSVQSVQSVQSAPSAQPVLSGPAGQSAQNGHAGQSLQTVQPASSAQAGPLSPSTQQPPFASPAPTAQPASSGTAGSPNAPFGVGPSATTGSSLVVQATGSSTNPAWAGTSGGPSPLQRSSRAPYFIGVAMLAAVGITAGVLRPWESRAPAKSASATSTVALADSPPTATSNPTDNAPVAPETTPSQTNPAPSSPSEVPSGDPSNGGEPSSEPTIGTGNPTGVTTGATTKPNAPTARPPHTAPSTTPTTPTTSTATSTATTKTPRTMY